MYKVSFYTPLNKTSPIKVFLNLTRESVRSKILRQLKYLQEFGLTPANPSLKKLTDTPLWEIRILGKDNIRIFCMSLPSKEVKILHVFIKKQQKTPSKEINLALKRYQKIISQTN